MKKTTAYIILIILLAIVPTISAQRQRTTIKGPLKTSVSARSDKPATDVNASTDPTTDTITVETERFVHLSGYDKPVSASRETLHVSNLSDSLTVTGINFEIRYLDRRGRELHRRDVSLHHMVEPGRTELVTFPTWDIQRSFYYILSVKPRRQATPYDVTCRVNYLITTTTNNH